MKEKGSQLTLAAKQALCFKGRASGRKPEKAGLNGIWLTKHLSYHSLIPGEITLFVIIQ